MDGVRCTGRESRLIDCTHNGFGFKTCSNSLDIALECIGYETVMIDSSEWYRYITVLYKAVPMDIKILEELS